MLRVDREELHGLALQTVDKYRSRKLVNSNFIKTFLLQNFQLFMPYNFSILYHPNHDLTSVYTY